jgi:hypothetical protein
MSRSPTGTSTFRCDPWVSDIQTIVTSDFGSVFWFTKANLEFFLPYAMAYATDEALSRIRRYVADDQLRTALRTAPIGLFNLQSWQYWHTILGVLSVPPRPRRDFLRGDAELDDRFSKCVPRSLPISA